MWGSAPADDAWDRLEVAASQRDRWAYGVVLPLVLFGGGGALALLVPPPTPTAAAVAFYGVALVLMLAGAGLGLSVWRARLVVGPWGVTVRGALRERLIPWGRLEAVHVGPPSPRARRRAHGGPWQALHVRVVGEAAPIVAAATNRPQRQMTSLAHRLDRVLAAYGHRIQIGR